MIKRVLKLVRIVLPITACILYVFLYRPESRTVVLTAQSDLHETQGEDDFEGSKAGDMSGETKLRDDSETADRQEADAGVNINTASEQELMQLKGIGEVKARAIVEYRSSHGAFTAKEDIMQVPGIKEGTYSKIADRIYVNDREEAGNAEEDSGS